MSAPCCLPQKTWTATRQRALCLVSSSRDVEASARASSSRASTTGASAGADSTPQQSNIDCVGTGMDVQCYVTNDEANQLSSTIESKTYGFTDEDVHPGQHVECVETGFGVSCFVADDEPGASIQADTAAKESSKSAAATAVPAVEQQQQQQQPRTAAAAAASGSAGPLQQLLGVALLISPFFFWGTSMVAMKVRCVYSSGCQCARTAPGGHKSVCTGSSNAGYHAMTLRPVPYVF